MKEELTIGRAADFLNVSHSYVLDLLESGALPVRLVGSERRVRTEDLARYKEQIDAQRRKVLDELTAEAQELGFGILRPATAGAIAFFNIRGVLDGTRGSLDVDPASPSAAARESRRVPFERPRSARG